MIAVNPSASATVEGRANDLAQYLPVIATSGARWRAFEANGCWREVQRDMFRPHAQAVLPVSIRTPRNERQLLDQLEGRWQTDERMFKGALMADEGKLDQMLVNVPNGTLRVTPTEIKLMEHDKRYGFTKALAATWVDDRHNQLFEQVLNETLPDAEDQHLFHLWCGYLLLADCRLETALACFGEAGSGKDTVATPITYVLDGGEPNQGTVTRLSMAQVCDSNCYALAKLRYACVNICSELDSRAIEESTNFKQIVSGSPIEAREIRCAPFTMSPHCKLWSLTNEMPRFKNGTNAEQRRMRFLPFQQVVAKIDTTIKERLKVACPGVLNYMLSGLQAVLGLGGNQFPLGGAMARGIHARFQVSNDPIGSFVRQHCTLGPALQACKDKLLDAFRQHCEQLGFSTELPEHFYRKLYDRYTDLKSTRPHIGGVRTYVVMGIALKEPVQAV